MFFQNLEVHVVILVAVTVLALLIVDDIGRVIGDDIEEDLYTSGMGFGDKGGQFGIGAKVGVELGHVHVPVAMISGGNVRAGTLDWVVFENRGHPNSGGAHRFQVIELAGQASQVTSWFARKARAPTPSP